MGHLIGSFILLVWVFESGQHLYRSVIVLSVRVWGCTYIDRPSPYHVSSASGTAPISIGHSSCQFEFSGPHLYQSTISLSCQFNFWDRTYIDWSFVVSVWVFGAAPISIGHLPICLCSVWVGTALISIDHFSCQFEFLRPHLYRSAIFLSFWVWVFESGPNIYRSVIRRVSLSFQGRTRIDRPSSYHFHVNLSFRDRTYID